MGTVTLPTVTGTVPEADVAMVVVPTTSFGAEAPDVVYSTLALHEAALAWMVQLTAFVTAPVAGVVMVPEEPPPPPQAAMIVATKKVTTVARVWP